MKGLIMVDSYTLIDSICVVFNIDKSAEVKRKFGKLPSYTYDDILTRLLKYTDSRTPITTIFPEMSRPTISTMLKAAFPQKEDPKQPWISFLLGAIGMKLCCKCRELMPIDMFYLDSRAASGIRGICTTCDNILNKVHRDANKEYYSVKKHEHYENNRAYYRAKKLKRDKSISTATPAWANLHTMNMIYSKTPAGYHVDHIVPINSDIVCGLHCEHNLQYLLAADNLSKSNSFCIDTYQHVLP
jgi:hypothetical protein